jgi:predicted ester cyclase
MAGETRYKILDAAEKLIPLKGLACETAKEIARETGLSERTLPQVYCMTGCFKKGNHNMTETLETNKAIVQRFFEEAWDQRNYALLDEIIDPDCVLHDPNPTLNGSRGPAGYRQWLEATRPGVPDVRHELEQFAEGDTVVTFYTAHGTHQGRIGGVLANVAPTGKALHYQGYMISRVVHGKIVDQRQQVNILSVMQQLGAVPAPLQPPTT